MLQWLHRNRAASLNSCSLTTKLGSCRPCTPGPQSLSSKASSLNLDEAGIQRGLSEKLLDAININFFMSGLP